MPNAANKEQLAEIKELLDGTGAVWVVDYRGLSVKEIQQLRRDIRANEGQMFVLKNTLMHIALEELEMPSMDEILSGPSAFVFTGEDPVASAKAIKNFAKGNDKLVIKGGIMDGQFQDAAAVQAIADLPSREELIAKLLGTINNPMAKTVRTLNAILEAPVRAISEIAKKAA
ncbi:MAG: 50S ribosomal protein L10 [Phoenicibacter congonensis]|uniref:Large ribosomal subunit protein uL10 n=1 Tax=Phoenicibacter congonensis TaxID=1944646 RepID=A0AA43RIT3_9ACTN|nr:50S ribosomal protein L10 [Phoenicibacter congonensis]